MGPIERSIHEDLRQAFPESQIEVLNESSQHSVPKGSESHFRVGVVGACWDGKALVQRHRAVHAALRKQLDAGLHALTVEAWTTDEWSARGGALASSPRCLGGSHKH